MYLEEGDIDCFGVIDVLVCCFYEVLGLCVLYMGWNVLVLVCVYLLLDGLVVGE